MGSLVDQVRTKQARLTAIFAEAAALEAELNEAFRMLSPSSGRPMVPLTPRALTIAPKPQPKPVDVPKAAAPTPSAPATPAVDADVERQVRCALMSGPLAKPTDAHDLQTLKERCEDITGLRPDTVKRVLDSLLERGLVTCERDLYRRAA